MNWKRAVMRGLAETASFVRRNRASCAGFRVLLYHSVNEQDAIGPEGIFCIKPDLFESHMVALSKMPEVECVTFEEGLSPAGRLSVAVSFDDGYKDNLYNAAPKILDYNIPFTLFVSPSRIQSNDEKYLTPSELRELSSLPSVSIGAHGMTHIPLTACDDFTLMNELVSSKKYIEDLIGGAVTTMSYPFGAVDRRVRDAVERAGYLLASCSRFDINDASRDPLLLCRTEITGNDSVRVFQQKLHGDWDWYRWRRKDPVLIC
jgi:peptidoglycan/xylan/chitin deacetylase (PgdA/CDA1 family)